MTREAQAACHIDPAILAAGDTAGDATAGLAKVFPSFDVIYLVDTDPAVLEACMRAMRGVQAMLGISLDYPDGLDPRRSGAAPADVLLREALLFRLTAFATIAARQGLKLSTVGCHGALALDVADDERTTQVVARSVQHFDAALSLAVAAGSRGIAVAHHCGVRAVREAWHDVVVAPSYRCEGVAIASRVDRYRVRYCAPLALTPA